jgi:hypothetical protein
MTEYLRMSGIYWGLTVMDLMNSLDKMNKDEVLDFVKQCQHDCGGIGASVGHDPHLLYTLSAIQVSPMKQRCCLFDLTFDNPVTVVKKLQKYSKILTFFLCHSILLIYSPGCYKIKVTLSQFLTPRDGSMANQMSGFVFKFFFVLFSMKIWILIKEIDYFVVFPQNLDNCAQRPSLKLILTCHPIIFVSDFNPV